MKNQKFAQLPPYSLYGSGVSIGATEITLKTMLDPDGNALTMSGAFGVKGYGVHEPGNTASTEAVTFSGLTNNSNGTVTLTGVKTVTFTDPLTETSGLAKTHAGSTTFIITNSPSMYNDMTSNDNDETITGTYTFTAPNYPRIDTVATPPTDPEQLVTKSYADALTYAGAPDASTSTKGIVEIPTQAQVDAKTGTGETGAKLVVTPDTQRSTKVFDYAVATGAVNTYAITVTPDLTGDLVGGEIFTFKANTTNTNDATLNVNGIGAISILRSYGAALQVGDLVINNIYTVVFNGSDFLLQSPNAATLYSDSVIPNLKDNSLLAAEAITAGQPLAVGPYTTTPITFDAKSGGTTTASGGAKTISFTVGGNSNRGLFLYVLAAQSQTITATYNAVSMSEALSSVLCLGNNYKLFSFYLAAPATGTSNLIISGLGTSEVFSYGLYSYYNVNQSTPTAQTVYATDANYSVSKVVTPLNAGSILLSASFFEANSGTFTNVNMGANSIASANINTIGASNQCGGYGGSYLVHNTNNVTVSSATTVGTLTPIIMSMEIKPVTAVTYRVYKASSAAASSYLYNNEWKATSFIGFASANATLGNAVTIKTNGTVTGLSSLLPSSQYYLANTAGTIGSTAGTVTRKVGISMSDTSLLITNEP